MVEVVQIVENRYSQHIGVYIDSMYIIAELAGELFEPKHAKLEVKQMDGSKQGFLYHRMVKRNMALAFIMWAKKKKPRPP